jgi:tetratricopeptide (TPR) repeat protein
MSEMASEMLDKNEYDHAMFLFKQSNIECGRSFFFDPHLIWNALDKCTPNNPDAMLVKACLSLSDLPNAAAFTEQCIRTFPRDAHLHRILACIYRFLHEYEKALHEIEKAIELDPSHKRWLCIKAMCIHFTQDVMNGGKRDEAIECYKEYLASNPSDDNKVPTALYCIANLYMFKEDVDNVCLYWEKATEAEKNRLECFEMLGETKFEFKDEIADYLRQLLLMCGACERLKPKFKCACMEEAYCDRKCQMGNWRAHKKICKAKK